MAKMDILDEKFIIAKFWFTVHPQQKVRVKEIFEKHNQEIKWKYQEESIRDENGDKIFLLELVSFDESLSNLQDKIGFCKGIIDEIYQANIFTWTEEHSAKYGLMGFNILTGQDIEELDLYSIRNTNKKTNYYLREAFASHLIFLADINKILEVEKVYPKIVMATFGRLVEDWYKEEIAIINKRMVNKEKFELAKSLVQRMENSNIKRIPYTLKKFRFLHQD